MISFIYYCCFMLCMINSKPLKKISQTESFLSPDKQGTPEEGQRIQWPKCWVLTNTNWDEDNSLKNHHQNNTHQALSQNFRQRRNDIP